MARVTATIVHNWKLRAFPFDHHDIEVHVEDSKLVAKSLQFKPDKKNSGRSTPDELALPGWRFTKFDICAADKRYHTNFGDTSFTAGSNRGESGGDPGASEKDSASAYSRLTFSMRMERAGPGPAIKLLAPAIIATLVAFVAFLIRPTDVDPRFGLGIGALFAVAASGLVVASYVPDSDELTMADMVYMAAMLFIGASLVQSAVCLKWCESGKTKWKVVNLWSIIVFPLLFVVAIVGIKNAWS